MISDFRFTKVKHQYDLKLQEVEHLKDRLEQGSHHQQLEEVNALKDSISEFFFFFFFFFFFLNLACPCKLSESLTFTTLLANSAENRN